MDWERESDLLVADFALVPLCALAFLIIRFLLDRTIFQKLGTLCIQKHNKLDKFKESAWKFTYYFVATVLGLMATFQEPWFYDSKHFFKGPGEQVWPDLKIKLKNKMLYIFSAGFYAYSIPSLIFWETRRKDFTVSMTHHIVTLILIAGSYPIRFARVGSMVLVLHDACDIFLELAKMSNYSGSDTVSLVFICVFLVSWVGLRLVVYPFQIIRSTSYEVLQILDKDAAKQFCGWLYYVFNTSLITLLVLHCYWTKGIYKVIQKARNGKIQDTRSDSEEDD